MAKKNKNKKSQDDGQKGNGEHVGPYFIHRCILILLPSSLVPNVKWFYQQNVWYKFKLIKISNAKRVSCPIVDTWFALAGGNREGFLIIYCKAILEKLTLLLLIFIESTCVMIIMQHFINIYCDITLQNLIYELKLIHTFSLWSNFYANPNPKWWKTHDRYYHRVIYLSKISTPRDRYTWDVPLSKLKNYDNTLMYLA